MVSAKLRAFARWWDFITTEVAINVNAFRFHWQQKLQNFESRHVAASLRALAPLDHLQNFHRSKNKFMSADGSNCTSKVRTSVHELPRE